MPFTAIRLDDGNTLIGCTLGNLVIEVDADGKKVWQLTNDDLPGKPINDACGVQRLPNGNTVVTSHHADGEQGQADRGDAGTRSVVWTYTDDRPTRHPPLPDPGHGRPHRSQAGRSASPLRLKSCPAPCRTIPWPNSVRAFPGLPVRRPMP